MVARQSPTPIPPRPNARSTATRLQCHSLPGPFGVNCFYFGANCTLPGLAMVKICKHAVAMSTKREPQATIVIGYTAIQQRHQQGFRSSGRRDRAAPPQLYLSTPIHAIFTQHPQRAGVHSSSTAKATLTVQRSRVPCPWGPASGATQTYWLFYQSITIAKRRVPLCRSASHEPPLQVSSFRPPVQTLTCGLKASEA